MGHIENLVSIKKMLNIINSCESNKQLKSSLILIQNYLKLLSKQKIKNIKDVETRLITEYNQKKFQLSMMSIFIKNCNKEFSLVAI